MPETEKLACRSTINWTTQNCPSIADTDPETSVYEIRLKFQTIC